MPSNPISSESEGTESGKTDKGNFPGTRWSMVLAAGGGGTREARVALEELCRRYWLPVYVAIRGSGREPEDAEDLTQDFFAALISRSALDKPRPERGRFRTFLLTALDRFLVDDWRRQSAQKRGGQATIISVDRELAEQRFEIAARIDEQPDRLFERQWARELLERAMRQLAELFEAEGKGKQFAVLRPWIATQGREGAYAQISQQLGISENNARATVFRLRRRFRRLLREEIAETVSEGDSVDDELQHLFAIFSQ